MKLSIEGEKEFELMKKRELINMICNAMLYMLFAGAGMNELEARIPDMLHEFQNEFGLFG